VAGGFGDEASSKFFELDACESRRRAQHDLHDVHFPSANEQVVRDLVDVLLRAMLPNPSTTEIKWAVRTSGEAGNAEKRSRTWPGSDDLRYDSSKGSSHSAS
jgi:hypothetical protein